MALNLSWNNLSAGAANAATLGLQAIATSTVVLSDDVPPGSQANGYVEAAAGAALSFTFEPTSAVFNGVETHMMSFWVMCVQVGAPMGTGATIGRFIDHTTTSGSVPASGYRLLSETHLLDSSNAARGWYITATALSEGTADGMSGTPGAAVRYNEWARVDVMLGREAGEYIIAFNGVKTRWTTGVDETGYNDTNSRNLAFNLPAKAEVQWRLCAPIVTGPSIDIEPAIELFADDTDHVSEYWPFHYTGSFTEKGTFWSLPASGVTISGMASGGVNPQIRRVTWSDAQSVTSRRSVPRRFNADGWASACFHMLRPPFTIRFRNTTNSADVLTISATDGAVLQVNGANFTSSDAVSPTMSASKRYVLFVSYSITGAATITLFNNTDAITSRACWSNAVANVNQAFGLIIYDGINTTEVCGVQFGPYNTLLLGDSMTAANVNGLTPLAHTINNIGAWQQTYGDISCIPGGAWLRYGMGAERRGHPAVVGHAGLTLANLWTHAMQYATHLYGVCATLMDLGAINDFNGGATVATVSGLVESLADLLHANGNKFEPWTIGIRPTSGSVTAGSAAVRERCGKINTWLREEVAARVTDGELVTLYDPAEFYAPMSNAFTGGDGTHTIDSEEDNWVDAGWANRYPKIKSVPANKLTAVDVTLMLAALNADTTTNGLKANVDATKAVTDALSPRLPVSGTISTLNAAQVNAEADTALADYAPATATQATAIQSTVSTIATNTTTIAVNAQAASTNTTTIINKVDDVQAAVEGIEAGVDLTDEQFDTLVATLAQQGITITSPIDPETYEIDGIYAGQSFSETITITNYAGDYQHGDTVKIRFIRQSQYERSGASAAAEVEATATVTLSAGTLTIPVALTAEQTAGFTTKFPVDSSPTHQYQIIAANRSLPVVDSTCTVRRLIEAAS